MFACLCLQHLHAVRRVLCAICMLCAESAARCDFTHVCSMLWPTVAYVLHVVAMWPTCCTAGYVLNAATNVLHAMAYVLHAAAYVLHAVAYVLHAARCGLRVACCGLFAALRPKCCMLWLT